VRDVAVDADRRGQERVRPRAAEAFGVGVAADDHHVPPVRAGADRVQELLDPRPRAPHLTPAGWRPRGGRRVRLAPLARHHRAVLIVHHAPPRAWDSKPHAPAPLRGPRWTGDARSRAAGRDLRLAMLASPPRTPLPPAR